MRGGVVPGGMIRSNVWQIEVIWATPASTLAPSWKYTLMTATPLYDWDSICSMSLTVVVIARSQTVTKRFSISSAATPE